MDPSVLGPRSLVVPRIEWHFLAIAYGFEPRGRNAERNEHLADGAGALCPESKVVFDGAALISMPFKNDSELRILPEQLSIVFYILPGD
jgi:hypothetical protein